MGRDDLAGYLQDHLAGATAGLALFRRTAADVPDLAPLVEQVEQDRESLLALMAAVRVPARRRDVLLGTVTQRAGRVPLAVRRRRRPALADLVQLEALLLGVQGKAAGFRALRVRADPRLDAAELDRLVARAERQAAELERLRLVAAARALCS